MSRIQSDGVALANAHKPHFPWPFADRKPQYVPAPFTPRRMESVPTVWARKGDGARRHARLTLWTALGLACIVAFVVASRT